MRRACFFSFKRLLFGVLRDGEKKHAKMEKGGRWLIWLRFNVRLLKQRPGCTAKPAAQQDVGKGLLALEENEWPSLIPSRCITKELFLLPKPRKRAQLSFTDIRCPCSLKMHASWQSPRCHLDFVLLFIFLWENTPLLPVEVDDTLLWYGCSEAGHANSSTADEEYSKH